ncbi:MAG TPA: hypothetical protein VGR13_03070, partial [Actinomycetota bacterium]|nr:hypothetical protein [Actinomycetota bacterium]
MRGKNLIRRWALLGVIALVAAACGGDAETPSSPRPTGGTTSPGGSVYDVSLKGICPDKIVLQTDWFPEVEHGASYNL